LNKYKNPRTSEVYEVQMETVEGIFSWLAVLWERGFVHENPQGPLSFSLSSTLSGSADLYFFVIWLVFNY